MVVKTLVVNLEKDQWEALLVIRALTGAESWNEFFHKLLENPADLIISLVGRKNLLSDMQGLVEKIEKGEIKG